MDFVVDDLKGCVYIYILDFNVKNVEKEDLYSQLSQPY